MAENTSVNAQITDAITQSNVINVGEAPAVALAIATQALAQAAGLAAQNAVQAQGAMQQINNAATSALVTQIMQAGPMQDLTREAAMTPPNRPGNPDLA